MNHKCLCYYYYSETISKPKIPKTKEPCSYMYICALDWELEIDTIYKNQINLQTSENYGISSERMISKFCQTIVLGVERRRRVHLGFLVHVRIPPFY